MADKVVAADPEVLQAADKGGHVLQGGEVVVADVEASQDVQVRRGFRAEVGEAGVVRESQSLGVGQLGQTSRLHLPQQGTVAHLNTVQSTPGQNTINGSFLVPWGGKWEDILKKFSKIHFLWSKHFSNYFSKIK